MRLDLSSQARHLSSTDFYNCLEGLPDPWGEDATLTFAAEVIGFTQHLDDSIHDEGKLDHKSYLFNGQEMTPHYEHYRGK
ncbi:hypothetical protein [uncultured Microbulbifer sp.]|uniref:hypothetical protein n=1 Tax=uncultured Microbulbifer sp. TaxID=348147 RepID=UPI00260F6898|nr:hypothetical protein [uncultured Microbulbifer sp.]